MRSPADRAALVLGAAMLSVPLLDHPGLKTRMPDVPRGVITQEVPQLARGVTGHAAAQSSAIDTADIGRALDVVKADPLITPQQTFKNLKWQESAARKRSATPTWILWIAGLFAWLGQSARYFVWAAAAVFAVLLARYVIATLAPHVTVAADEPPVAPTHVRDLDIRPESLPENIGAAARSLWDDGHHRAALALLYRGLLSRLAHVHDIPIADSTTEGDCLALAATHLPSERRDYASRLIRAWQRAVYGREPIETAAVHDLCDGFAAAMNFVSFGPGPGGAA